MHWVNGDLRSCNSVVFKQEIRISNYYEFDNPKHFNSKKALTYKNQTFKDTHRNNYKQQIKVLNSSELKKVEVLQFNQEYRSQGHISEDQAIWKSRTRHLGIGTGIRFHN